MGALVQDGDTHGHGLRSMSQIFRLETSSSPSSSSSEKYLSVCLSVRLSVSLSVFLLLSSSVSLWLPLCFKGYGPLSEQQLVWSSVWRPHTTQVGAFRGVHRHAKMFSLPLSPLIPLNHTSSFILVIPTQTQGQPQPHISCYSLCHKCHTRQCFSPSEPSV